VLNPFASDINLFPETLGSVKARIVKKFRLPSARLIPDALLSLRGKLTDDPGRLYTFLGCKRDL